MGLRGGGFKFPSPPSVSWFSSTPAGIGLKKKFNQNKFSKSFKNKNCINYDQTKHKYFDKWNLVLATNSNLLIPIFLQPNGLKLLYFKLKLLDL